MSSSVTLIVDSDARRLDRFVADRVPDLSRSRLHRLISDGSSNPVNCDATLFNHFLRFTS